MMLVDDSAPTVTASFDSRDPLVGWQAQSTGRSRFTVLLEAEMGGSTFSGNPILMSGTPTVDLFSVAATGKGTTQSMRSSRK